jgi:hypothetical protein
VAEADPITLALASTPFPLVTPYGVYQIGDV